MSAPDLSCFDYIIGLYNGDCDCYDPKPEDYDESLSGLFISDMLEPKLIDGLLNCDQGVSVWALMETVRALAIRNFITDANALLMKSARLKRTPYRGGIGRNKWTKNLSTSAYAGIRIKAADVRGGYLKITSIGTLFDTTTSFNILIYDNNGDLLHTVPVDATADRLTQNAVDIELPLHDNYQDNLEYFLLYEPDGFQPKNNDVTCTCDKTRPAWGRWTGWGKYGWGEWLQVGGYNGNLPDFMNISSSANNYMYGLTLQVELGCYINTVFCPDIMDFDGNTLAQATAVAIVRSAAALFIDKLLRTPNLNRAVMLDREGLQKAKEEYLESYQGMMTYIVDNLDLTRNDCLECVDIIDLIRGGIMA